MHENGVSRGRLAGRIVPFRAGHGVMALHEVPDGFGNVPLLQKAVAQHRVIVPQKGALRLDERTPRAFRVLHQGGHHPGKARQQDDPAQVMQQSGQEKTFLGRVSPGKGEKARKDAARDGMLPEGFHIHHVRRNVFEDADRRDRERERCEFVRADDRHGARDRRDGGRKAVERAVHEPEQPDRQARVLADDLRDVRGGADGRVEHLPDLEVDIRERSEADVLPQEKLRRHPLFGDIDIRARPQDVRTGTMQLFKLREGTGSTCGDPLREPEAAQSTQFREASVVVVARRKKQGGDPLTLARRILVDTGLFLDFRVVGSLDIGFDDAPDLHHPGMLVRQRRALRQN